MADRSPAPVPTTWPKRRGVLLAVWLAEVLLLGVPTGSAAAAAVPVLVPDVAAGEGTAGSSAGSSVPVSGTWPLQPQPEVVGNFAPPEVRWGSGHRGVDLLGTVGAPVHAALAGEVTFAGVIAGRGVVVVDHGGRRTTYEPVLASVHRGDEVAAGDVIGHLAFAGSHCSPSACLHWGLLQGDTYLDPLSLIGGPKPVRLYPTTDFDPATDLAAGEPTGSPGTGSATVPWTTTPVTGLWNASVPAPAAGEAGQAAGTRLAQGSLRASRSPRMSLRAAVDAVIGATLPWAIHAVSRSG